MWCVPKWWPCSDSTRLTTGPSGAPSNKDTLKCECGCVGRTCTVSNHAFILTYDFPPCSYSSAISEMAIHNTCRGAVQILGNPGNSQNQVGIRELHEKELLHISCMHISFMCM